MKNIYNYEELPPILTIPQLAEFLGVGNSLAYDLARSNQLAVLRLGSNTIHVPRHSLLEYLGVPRDFID